MKPLVSIIIPVYDVSQYLRKCLDSVVKQTLKDIEIIIVNDCSPDPMDDAICKEYAQKDSRIIYFQHEKNLGLGGARNTGLRLATAQYVGGVDSDDWIELDMYELMYNNAIETSADIVVCNLKPSKNHPATTLYQNAVISVAPHNVCNVLNPAFWNKLWKRELFINNNLFFPENLPFEDLSVTPRVVFYSEKISFMKNILYHYRVRERGLSYTGDKTGVDGYFKAFELILDFLSEKQVFDEYKEIYLHFIFQHLQNLSKNVSTFCQKEKELKSLCYFYTSLFNFKYVDELLQINRISPEKILQIFDNDVVVLNSADYQELRKSKTDYEKILKNRWYIFGQYSRYNKIKAMIKYFFGTFNKFFSRNFNKRD